MWLSRMHPGSRVPVEMFGLQSIVYFWFAGLAVACKKKKNGAGKKFFGRRDLPYDSLGIYCASISKVGIQLKKLSLLYTYEGINIVALT